MLKPLILILTVLCLSQSINLVYYEALPVSRLALFKALLSMKYLKSSLDETFNTKFENKFNYYVRTKLTQSYLKDISKQLSQYNNVVVGANNGGIGKSNLIIGDNNMLTGSNNWIFSEGFNGKADKDLILQNWQVQVDKAESIMVDPRIAIRQW